MHAASPTGTRCTSLSFIRVTNVMVHLLLVVCLAHRNVRQDNRIETTERGAILPSVAPLCPTEQHLSGAQACVPRALNFLLRFSGNYPSTPSSLVRLVRVTGYCSALSLSGGDHSVGARSFDVHAAAALRRVGRARCQVHCSLLALTHTGGAASGFAPL